METQCLNKGKKGCPGSKEKHTETGIERKVDADRKRPLDTGLKEKTDELEPSSMENDKIGVEINVKQEEKISEQTVENWLSDKKAELKPVENDGMRENIVVQPDVMMNSFQLGNNYQEKDKEDIPDEFLNLQELNGAKNTNVGRQSWLHHMASKFSKQLRLLKGGVSKKVHRRRPVEKLTQPSPAFSRAFLLRLKNEGNFCYSNAAVACLLGNPLVSQFIKEENGPQDGPLYKLKALLRTPITR